MLEQLIDFFKTEQTTIEELEKQYIEKKLSLDTLLRELIEITLMIIYSRVMSTRRDFEKFRTKTDIDKKIIIERILIH